MRPIRAATRTIKAGKRRHPVVLSEIETPFLNGPQRSVNRKVQGSNPCSGAKSEFDFSPNAWPQAPQCSNGAATVQQLALPMNCRTVTVSRFRLRLGGHPSTLPNFPRG